MSEPKPQTTQEGIKPNFVVEAQRILEGLPVLVEGRNIGVVTSQIAYKLAIMFSTGVEAERASHDKAN